MLLHHYGEDMRDTVTNTLIDALEALGDDWAEHHMPQGLLNSSKNIRVLLGVRELIRDAASGVSLEMLRAGAPTFVEQHLEATCEDLGAFR
jgi:hypothetical protein